MEHLLAQLIGHGICELARVDEDALVGEVSQ
jgi:hypothetical protein